MADYYVREEDGTSRYILEDGSGDYLLEGSGGVSITDTGVTATDTLASLRGRPLTDTGASLADSISAVSGGHVTATDTGLTVTDALRKTVAKFPADTGTTVSDSLASHRTHTATDTGATLTDSLAKSAAKVLADTGLVLSDSLGYITLADNAFDTFSDSITGQRRAPRSVTDTGLTPSDTLVVSPTRRLLLVDTGLAGGDSIQKTATKLAIDTGCAVTDTLGRSHTTTIADTGLTVTDTTRKTASKVVTDQGVALSTTLVVSKNGHGASVNITDTGLAVASTLTKSASYFRAVPIFAPDTGLALTDGLTVQVNGAPPGSCTSDFRRFLLDLDASPEYAAWCSAEPGDCSTWTTYAAAILSGGAPSPPPMSTTFGGALVDAGVIALDGIVPCRAKPPPVTAPHAAFSFTVSGLTVAFRNLSTPGASGDYDSWLWDFGDGDTDTIDWSPYHTYAGAGTYLVTLTVVGSGSDGISSVRHPVTVSVPSAAGIHIDAVIL